MSNVDSEVFDALSSIANAYPDSIPLGAVYPLIVFKRVTTLRERSHDGTALIRPRYQFTCWATGPSPTPAKDLGRQVVAYFEPDLTCQIENHFDGGFSPDQKLYSVIVEVRFAAHSEDALLV